MSSPVKRFTREVLVPAQDIVASPAVTTILISRPVALTAQPLVPSNSSPADQVPLSARAVAGDNPRGTKFPNLLSTAGDDLSELGGLLSVKPVAPLAVAGVLLIEVALVDLLGQTVDVILSDTVGIPMNDATIANLLRNITIARKQTLQLKVKNAGALIAASTFVAIARFDLGINVQMPFDGQQFPSI